MFSVVANQELFANNTPPAGGRKYKLGVLGAIGVLTENPSLTLSGTYVLNSGSRLHPVINEILCSIAFDLDSWLDRRRLEDDKNQFSIEFSFKNE